MNIKLKSIEMDASIQCRANIDTALVNEYAERMSEGDKFPAVVLFGDKEKSWIGDGWHRILAAQQIGDKEVHAELKKGGRLEALKHALGANALHGHRRTNADKRRCVELALKEFPKMSTASLATMCGVSRPFVESLRPQDATVASSPRTGSDGKQYPAVRQPKEEPLETPEVQHERPKLGPPCDGMQHARIAVMQLEEIRPDDTERQEAFNYVKGWIENNEK